MGKQTAKATYKGLEKGPEPMMRMHPPQPAKDWAIFEVTEVCEYEKPGQYGDAQVEAKGLFRFVPTEQSQEVQDALAGIEVGATAKIGWQHDYVTMESKSE